MAISLAKSKLFEKYFKECMNSSQPSNFVVVMVVDRVNVWGGVEDGKWMITKKKTKNNNKEKPINQRNIFKIVTSRFFGPSISSPYHVPFFPLESLHVMYLNWKAALYWRYKPVCLCQC